PDMEPADAVTLSQVAVDAGAAGVVATNTTVDYSLVANPKNFGGISGRVLREKSFRLFDAVARALFGRAVLVSVGGIDSGAEAYRRIRAGASLVQLYTALVYHGPGLPRRINEELLELLARDGVKSVGEAVGADR
ncbi:MAG TPA: dihydroorotate dehydrogenase (quinone), partial [Thermoanaerobaculia bacterium]|nr:dihydroorotate dehydrogenase (quinone) [Thermoanaerobaculia bacterium]